MGKFQVGARTIEQHRGNGKRNRARFDALGRRYRIPPREQGAPPYTYAFLFPRATFNSPPGRGLGLKTTAGLTRRE